MSEKFDFTKIEDQDRFKNLSGEEREGIIGEAHKEADEIENQKCIEEERLNIEADKIIKDPEAILMDFVGEHFDDPRRIEGWEGKLQNRINSRLSGDTDERYLSILANSMKGRPPERKERIISAAYVHELQHRYEVGEGPHYNRKHLFQHLDNFSNGKGLLGATMNKMLDGISLKELPMHYGVALKRLLEGREKEDAEAILQDATKDLFRPILNSKNKSLRAEGFLQRINHNFNACRFSPEVLNYIIKLQKDQNPHLIDEVAIDIDKILTDFYRKGVLPDSKTQSNDYAYRYRLEKKHQDIISLQNILENSPLLNEAYQDAKKSRIAKDTEEAYLEHEKRKMIEAENNLRRKEAEDKKIIDHKKRQQEKEKNREESNLRCDRLVDKISSLVIDEVEFDRQIPVKTSEMMKAIKEKKRTYLSGLFSGYNWEIFYDKDEAVYMTVEDMKYGFYGDADMLRREALGRASQNKVREIDALIKRKQDDIYKAISSALSSVETENAVDAHEDYIARLDAIIQTEEGALASYHQSTISHQAMQEIINIAISKKEEFVESSQYKIIKSQAEENERRSAVVSAQESYLLDQIERQIDYLQELYGIGTGLNLHNVASSASREQGDNVGSVTIGFSQNLKMKQELKLEILAIQDSLEIEMGDDLESMKKRMAMVNWVVPHEIAHLVDISSDVLEKVFEGEELSATNAIVENWKGDNQDLAREMISLIAKETAIDAIGYRMVKEYGTTNLLEDTKQERIASATRGFVAMMDVLEYILENKTQDDEYRARYSILLLRFIANGEFLVDESKDNKVGSRDISSLEREIKKMTLIFNKFNKKTNFVESGQAREIIDLCKRCFKKVEEVLL